MRTRFIFIFVFLLLSISLVSAVDYSLPFNQDYSLNVPCFNNGTICSVNTECNMTLLYPDGTILLNDVVTNNQGSFRNVTLFASQLNQLGALASSFMYCCDNGLCGANTFDIEITADGEQSRTFPTQFIFVIFSFLMIWFGTTNERFRISKYAGSIFLIVIGVITLYPGYSFINYSTLMGQSLGFIFIGLGFYFWIEDNFSRKEQAQYFTQDPKDEVEEPEQEVVETITEFDDGRMEA